MQAQWEVDQHNRGDWPLPKEAVEEIQEKGLGRGRGGGVGPGKRGKPGVLGPSPDKAVVRSRVRRLRVVAVLGAWMHAASCGVISFFTLSLSMGKIFCTKASSCCLNSRAGYLASTCKNVICCSGSGRIPPAAMLNSFLEP